MQSIDFRRNNKTYTATKENWDFWGWSTTNDTTGLIGSKENTKDQNDAAWEAAKATVFKADKYDYTFYAIFTIHEWTMTFKSDSKTTFDTIPVVHGQPLIAPGAVPSLNEKDLGATERYRFLGWSQSPNNLIVTDEKSASIVDVTTIIASANLEFYAVFIKESVYDAISNEDWFKYDVIYWTDLMSETTHEGLKVTPSNDITLSGKITLPTEHNGKPVIACGGFKGHQVTHLFWKGDSKLLVYLSNAFDSVSTLQYVEMPSTLLEIAESAFTACRALALPDFSKCTSLTTIGGYAFNGSGSGEAGAILNIPGSVQSIGGGAFSFMRFGSKGHIFAQVNLGSATSPSQLVDISITATH